MEEWEGTYDISFDGDAMMLFVTGLIITLATTNSIIRTAMKMQNNRLTTIEYFVLSIANVVYPIARAIRLSVKGKDITVYFIWMAAGVVLTALFVVLYLYLKKALRAEEPVETVKS